MRDYAVAFIAIADELGAPLDRDAQFFQPRDQQPLMLILRKDLKERIGGQIRGDLLEVNPRPRFAFDPQADSGNLVSALEDDLSEIELAIKFESARVHGECAGRRARLGSLVDETWFYSKPGQPERED